MQVKKLVIFLIILGMLGLVSFGLTRASLADTVNIQTNDQTTVQQGGSVKVNNDANSNPNTGANTVYSNVGGSQTTTGNANSQTTIKNNFNNNSAVVPGCCQGGGGDGGGGGGGGNGGGEGTSGGAGGAGGGGGSAAVLGLSATDGPNGWETIFYLLGVVCLVSGIKLLDPCQG